MSARAGSKRHDLVTFSSNESAQPESTATPGWVGGQILRRSNPTANLKRGLLNSLLLRLEEDGASKLRYA